MMSFAGSFGALMRGSGLETALGCIYNKVTVSHLLSGKAIAKALRAHILLESSLMTLLLKPFFSDNTDLSQIEPSGSGTIGENDQLPSDDEDEIEEETENEMIENPEDPLTWLSIVFEKHQDLRVLTPSEYDE